VLDPRDHPPTAGRRRGPTAPGVAPAPVRGAGIPIGLTLTKFYIILATFTTRSRDG